MMSFKDLRHKLAEGDFSSLFHPNSKNAIHPSEVAGIFNGLPFDVALKTFRAFPITRQISVFSYLDILLQKQIIRSLTKDRAAFILNNLSSDDRLKLLTSFHGMEQSAMLDKLDEKKKKAVHNLLGYPQNSVARLINTEFATVSKEMSISQAIEHLQDNHKDSETANVIYVVDDEGKLIDDIPVRRLVLTKGHKQIEEIMDHYCVKLNIEDTADEAVTKFQEYDRTVLPVVDNHDMLLGVVTIDDVMDVAQEIGTKEMQKFGGLESLDYPYVKTPFFSLVRKRAGWLIILFLGEMLTATAMGYFEHEIAKAVMLSLFIPLMISSGGNCGSQAATLIIRALSVKELNLRDWWYVMRREFFSGLTLGLILGTIGFLRILAWQHLGWHNYGPHYVLLATTIFFSLIGIVMWGTMSGAMIPMILKRLKQDPAASSAPFVATLVDVTGLIIYFSIAAFILHGSLL